MIAWFAAFLMLIAFAGSASGQSDPDVWTYARNCYERIHLDPADLAGPFDCTKGSRLLSTVDGVVQDRDRCKGSSCAQGIPPKCDFPTWLDDDCYGHSYIQVLPTPSNPKVTAALLCRHKTRWGLGPAPLLDWDGNLITGFDDIAIIVHNEGNGETCWFQSHDGDDAHLDGSFFPGPHTVTDHDFWIRPTAARDVMCVKCHDSGPWLQSRWMNNAIGMGIVDDSSTPYKNREPPFDSWPEPRFVQLSDDDTCTLCHRIAAARENVDAADALGGPDFRTCDEWIRRATGKVHDRATTTGAAFENTHWMPLGHGEASEAAWNSEYRATVERIVDCCKAVGTQPKSTWPAGCEEVVPTPSCPIAEADDGSCPVSP